MFGAKLPPHELSVYEEMTLFVTELRVALTGAQLLVAFLLSLPFTAQFARVDALDHHVYFVAFFFAMAAALLLIAPSVYHRMHLHRWVVDPAKTLRSFNRLAVSGSLSLAASMSAVSFLVTRFVYSRNVAALVCALFVGAFAWFWFGLPRRHHREAVQKGIAPP